MEDFLSGNREASSYQRSLFALMKRRAVLGEDESRIVQESYGDADDYDPVIRLPYTIEEPDLRKRVAAAANRLTSLRDVEHTPR